MNYMDTYNAVTGSIIAFLSLVFGEHWLLFAMFLLFNVADWLTGWMKSSIANKTNSIKKIGVLDDDPCCLCCKCGIY